MGKKKKIKVNFQTEVDYAVLTKTNIKIHLDA